MSTDATLRAREATVRATELLERTTELASFSTALGAEIERNRLELARRRLALDTARRSLATTLARNTLIEVSGTIDGADVAATWTDGRLVGSPELIRRAEMLVAVGERLTYGEAGDSDEADEVHTEAPVPSFTASLAGPPLVVALTLMRACTRVTSVDLPVQP
jgi:hypothetical protein